MNRYNVTLGLVAAILCVGIGLYRCSGEEPPSTAGTTEPLRVADPSKNQDLRVRQMTIRWEGARHELAVPVLPWEKPVNAITVSRYSFDLDKLNPQGKEFNLVRVWKSGLIALSSRQFMDPTPLRREKAKAIAKQFFLDRGLPKAVLEVLTPTYHATSKDPKPRVIGYSANIAHHVQGMMVAGDALGMRIDPDGVKTFGGYWHNIEVKDTKVEPIDFDEDAMQACVRSQAGRYDWMNPPVPTVKWVRPVYYVGDLIEEDNAEARVVWEVCFTWGREYWDPVKKQLVDYVAHARAQAEEEIVADDD